MDRVNLLKGAQGLFILIAVFAGIVVLFKYVTVDLKAPIPGGGNTIVDMSSPYGEIGKFLLSIHSFAIKTFVVSLIITILLNIQVKNSY
ncbi:hypothetical protein [Sediminibacillus terrae]|uniref:hypothetical protein n=1 Tax=Sediminibacillus terrae TaxID=1562106 RepID=UPI0012975847|nr:hypothetical protein [Sediminibacillus terrae]